MSKSKSKHGSTPTKAQRRRAIRQSYGSYRKQHQRYCALTRQSPLYMALHDLADQWAPRSVLSHETHQWNRSLRKTASLSRRFARILHEPTTSILWESP